MSSSKVMVALRTRYAESGNVLLTEVPNATGGRIARFADAIVMGTWPSRGLSISGFEVKAFRSDWIKELREPAKAEAIARYCDYWWLVVSDEKIASKEEVPENWGYMALRGEKLFTLREPVKLDPKPLDRIFLAALLRRASEQIVPADETAEQLRKKYNEGLKEGERRSRTDATRFEQELNHLKKRIEEFERASGVKFEPWNMGNIAALIPMVQQPQKNDASFLYTIRDRRRRLEAEKNALDAALDAYTKLEIPNAGANPQPPASPGSDRPPEAGVV